MLRLPGLVFVLLLNSGKLCSEREHKDSNLQMRKLKRILDPLENEKYSTLSSFIEYLSKVLEKESVGRSSEDDEEDDDDKKDWTYRGRSGVEFWSDSYPDCGGWRQSPINIDSSITDIRDDLPRLHFHHYEYVTHENTRLINNGRTLELKFLYFERKKPTLFGGPLKQKYNLIGAHFHWGINSCMGSEHAINNNRYKILKINVAAASKITALAFK